MKSRYYILIFFLLSVGLRAQTVLDTAVNFTVKDVTGLTHRLYEYLEQDKIVVIDFFTITCGPCSTYAPMVNESYTHFGCNSSNVIFLGINWGADNAGVTEFGNTYGVRYPEISGTEGNGNHVVADYGVLSYPTVILILPDSYIAEEYIWPPETGHLDSIIISYGGIITDCHTPNKEFTATTINKITSIFPVPAVGILTCLTSLTELGFVEIYSASGIIVTDRIPVSPQETVRIGTSELAPGFYLLLLRNNSGIVLDQKPFIVQ